MKKRKTSSYEWKVFAAILVGLIALFVGTGIFFLKKQGSAPWIAIGLIIIGILAIICAIYLRKTKHHEPDYRQFFTMGIIFTGAGIAMGNTVMWLVGLVFMGVALANRKKWKQPRKWSELSPAERKIKIIVLIVLSVLVILGFVLFYMASKGML